MTRFFSSIVLAAALLSSGLARAEAAPAANLPTATIHTADLNLRSAMGRDALDGRIRGAANLLCGANHTLPLDSSARTRTCRAELFRSAERQVRVALRRGQVELLGTR
ncbi:MAG TPA: UrcA family protein [Allosphingosinicella sp.]|jgi:UrcA family protein